MKTMDEQPDSVTIGEITNEIRRLSKSWNKVKKARSEWDFKTLRKELASLDESIRNIADGWSEKRGTIDSAVEEKRGFVKSDAYAEMIDAAFKDTDIPIAGEFPRYELPPFRLEIEQEEEVAKLLFGRKQEKTTVMSPKQLADWVVARYNRIVNKKFDSNRFCRELFGAYKFANQLALKEKSVLLGRAINLKDIYDLLTIRRDSKRDYPLELFTFELTQLARDPNIGYKDHRFELGYSRDQSRSFILKDKDGRENRVTTLTIHQKEEE